MLILTDYSQWYDVIFDDRPPVFQRLAFPSGGLSKPAQFELFRSLQLATPVSGRVRELAHQVRQLKRNVSAPAVVCADYRCIVYLDELAHRGEGKALLPLDEAAASYPEKFASLFVPPFGAPVAFRLVRFGQWAFWLRQTGDPNQWRSNRQDHESLLEKWRCTESNPIARVLWAIDFIPGPSGLLAVDFNTAPDLATLGEQKALSPEEVRVELNNAAATATKQLEQF